MRALKRLLAKMTPASRLYFDTTNQTKTVDGGRASFLYKDEPTPFRCSGPHSPSKAEGVAGSYSMGRRIQHPDCSIQALQMLCGSLLLLYSGLCRGFPTTQSGHLRNLL